MEKYLKKVAFITDRAYPIYTGGYEHAAFNISQKLADYYDVTIFTSMEDEYKLIGKVKYLKIANRYRFTNSKGTHNLRDSIRFVSSVIENLDLLNTYDFVILNTIPYILFGYILGQLKPAKVSIFYEAWFDYISKKNIFFKLAFYHEVEKLVQNSNSIIAVSSKTKESLISHYQANNVHLIPLGINKNIDNSRSKIKYDLIYLGRLVKIKHVDTLLRSAKLITEMFPRLKIAIVGDGEQYNNLVKLSNGLGLSNNIDYLGNQDGEAKYSILKASKIFILPSEREGFSISTLEAMFCGAVPIVAKPRCDEVFGTSDFVINNENGLYFKLGDERELFDKIIYLLSNSEQYRRMQNSAIETAKKYDWDSIGIMYCKVLNSF